MLLALYACIDMDDVVSISLAAFTSLDGSSIHFILGQPGIPGFINYF